MLRVGSEHLDHEARATIQHLMQDVCNTTKDLTIDQTATWGRTVDSVEVRLILTGGRSGATVLDADVTRHDDLHAERMVIKVAPAKEIAEEWRAVREALKGRPSNQFVPVSAVSGFIDDPGWVELPDQSAAIVYMHVGQLSASFEATVDSLEGLLENDSYEPSQLAALVASLTATLRHRLWGDGPRTRRALEDLNLELGASIALEIDTRVGDTTLSLGDPPPEERSLQANSQHILEAASTFDPAGATTMALGEIVELRSVTIRDPRDDVWTGVFGSALVEIRWVGDADERRRTADHLASDPDRRLIVIGRVTGIRSLRWWDLIGRADPTVELHADEVVVNGVRIGQPFNQVARHLTAELPHRAAGMTHGDLNPRNVLIVGGAAFVIDFARAAIRSPLTDPAFLEFCLLRDAFGPRLGVRRLVRLQRLLGLASRVADSMHEKWDPASALAVDDPELARAFRVLWSIRGGARNWYRGADPSRTGWWRDYLSHLCLAGIRTLKWTDKGRDATIVHTVLAGAGVAAEWLADRPYRLWPDAELRQAALAILSQVRPGAAEAGAIISELIAAVGAADIADADVQEVIGRCRDACVREWYTNIAARTLSSNVRTAGGYINLRARLERPDPDARGAVSAEEQPGDHEEPTSAIDQLLRAGWSAIALLGDAGSGKSTVVRELQLRHASAVLGSDARSSGAPEALPPPMASVTLMAAQISRALPAGNPAGAPPAVDEVLRVLLGDALGATMAAAFQLGGVLLTVDGFDDLDAVAHADVIAWIHALNDSYGRIRIVVCYRGFGVDATELGLPTLVLQEVSEREAREYIRELFKAKDPDRHEELTEDLIRALADDEVSGPIRELAQTPRFLWAITDWYLKHKRLPDRAGDLVRGLADQYIRRWLADHKADQVTYEQCVVALEILASRLAGDSSIDDAAAEGYLDHPGTDPRVLNALVGAGLISRGDGRIGFHHTAFQQYFEAVGLLRQDYDVAEFQRRLLSHNDRDDLRMMFLLTGGSPELAHQLMDVAVSADPVFAAELLRWTDQPHQEDVSRFLEAQERALYGRDGEYAWTTAAAALRAYGHADARRILNMVARSERADPLARSAALAGLLGRQDGIRFDHPRSASTRDVAESVRVLLDTADDPSLRVNAINAVVTGGLTTLIAYLAGLIGKQLPWPELRAVHRSLARLDQVLEPGQQAVYVAGCAQRLPACEQERQQAIDNATAERLHDERWELVEALAEAGRLDLVLPTRFSDAPTEHDYWSGRPTLTAAERDAVPEVARPAWDLLQERHTSATLVERFAAGDDLIAAVAAHRLLTEHRDGPRLLIEHVTAGSSRQQLLAAAGVSRIDEATLPRYGRSSVSSSAP